MKKILFTALAFTFAGSAFAANTDVPRFVEEKSDGTGSAATGTGCPTPDDYDIVVSEDGQTISYLFSKFYVENIKQTPEGKRFVVTSPVELRKSCGLRIKTQVPAGFSVQLITGDYRGFVANPFGDPLKMQAEYFFAGSRGPKFETWFPGVTYVTEPGKRQVPYDNVRQPKNGDFTITHKLIASAWSQCGYEPTLAANVNVSVPRARSATEDTASIIVDSADFKTEPLVIYHLQWQRCGNN